MLFELLKSLLTYKGISPGCGGAIRFLSNLFEQRGFVVTILESDGIRNLLVHNKDSRKIHLCFAGHVDVVPAADSGLWICNPFVGEVISETIYGRGVVDMKGAIASFITALFEFLDNYDSQLNIGVILTSDEEMSSSNGMLPMIRYLRQGGYVIHDCIVGEPTCESKIGDSIKIGRRGSLNVAVSYSGIQGHVAYHEKANNPIPEMLDALVRLRDHKFDNGNEFFPPSHCEITSIDVDNPSTNVIPGKVSTNFNIRFNNLQTVKRLKQAIDSIFVSRTSAVEIVYSENPALPFLSEKTAFADKLSAAILKCSGISAQFTTKGGTSDARFLREITNVLEFGLLNETAHKVNECAPLKDILLLKEIYLEFLKSL
ncbi:succinyl-diaminopimelate desuccinylase [Neorickettsia helminthoeca str. Oregon]|uniref:Succinyl-diaminopimelate desuccinylase n=1 Tax=Neorickettsia helminthoeca str. Oregon TaxID=1286528 RepID=X5HM96_9RICK|nr:succinyl-diaminopimelate desuccinylase [Neorickettsia helminthoeca]AHX11570.1 succinyl-diaminopimelate desuccinylase [Neorickettsia helminthoeca str. Oregon]